MEVREIWTDADFDDMGWHDSRLYSMRFLEGDLKVVFDIDYVFERQKEGDGEYWEYLVSPCRLIFSGVLHLRINLDFQNNVGIDISDILRENKKITPNKTAVQWEYVVVTSMGDIRFDAIGYKQVVLAQPVAPDGQCLGLRAKERVFSFPTN